MAKQKRKKTGRSANRSAAEDNLDAEISRAILGVIMIAFSLIGFLRTGELGEWFGRIMMFLFGRIYLGVFGLLFLIGIWLILRTRLPKLSFKITLGLIIAVLAVLLFCALPADHAVGAASFAAFWQKAGPIFRGEIIDPLGGLIGNGFYYLVSSLVAYSGSWIVGIALVITAVFLIVDRSYFRSFGEKMRDISLKAREKAASRRSEEAAPAKEPEVDIVNDAPPTPLISIKDEKAAPEVKLISLPGDDGTSQSSFVIEDEKDGTRAVKPDSEPAYSDYPNYRLPPIGRMLENVPAAKNSANEKNAKEKGQRLIEVLGQFSIKAELIDTYIGPSVTKFVIRPEASINVNRIVNIQDNIKMELAAKSIRIEAPIPGMTGVGVEIPNIETTPVRMRDILQRVPEKLKDNKLLVVLGKDLFASPVFCDLDKMPHLLVAGATGSGKSVCMNAIICSLLLRTRPSELKLLLIDPKKVEFTRYQQVPHLICPVIDDAKKASAVLQAVVTKMEKRYDVFAKAGVTKLSEYNEYAEIHRDDLKLKPLPYIVVIIDELADLMSVAGKEVEMSIQRITQLARAAGIHLIVATQRPSTDVITGLIKANIPSRISFAVTNGIDSRVILDQNGAENLLGNGDMLYKPQGISPKRLQGVFLTAAEIANITKYVASQGKPFYEDDIYSAVAAAESSDDEGYLDGRNEDPMYSEAVSFVIREQKASTSLLQRKFGLGYNRAARIVDMMQQRGVVGPANGSKPREVLIKSEADTGKTAEGH